MTLKNERSLRIAVCHKSGGPGWRWVLSSLPASCRVVAESFHVAPNGQRPSPNERARAFAGAGRVWRRHTVQPFDLILSFGPAAAMWVELRRMGRSGRHQCFGFNYTDLPSKPKRAVAARALRGMERAFVFTDAERVLYASAFDLPREVFERVDWGVSPPPTDRPVREGGYVAALGGEARDYATLAAAATMLPDVRFEVVARPRNLAGIRFPDNVQTRTDLPFEEAWGVVAAADVHVLSLVSSDTPCGIVTAVGAMHLGKAQVVTAGMGVTDYVKHEEQGLVVPPTDPSAMSGAIKRLLGDPTLRHRLGSSASERATVSFGEDATIRFAADLAASLRSVGG